MPILSPPGGPASWPATEGTIGVVGVAPWATLDFLRALYAPVVVKKDWHYPRVLCDINTKLPSRGRHLDLGERDPSPFIKETIAELATQGATVVVVPCNTAHILYERWAHSPPVPVPNIVEAAIEKISQTGASRIVTLSSGPVYRHHLYDKALPDSGLQSMRLSEPEVATVGAAITQVKERGSLLPQNREQLRAILRKKKQEGADGVILACTELGSLQSLCLELALDCADSGVALAEAALRTAKVPFTST